MEIKVKNLRVKKSPRKIRPLLLNLKGISTNDAIAALTFTEDSTSSTLIKLIKSAIASAKEKELDENRLIIKNLRCDQARGYKRYRFGSKGRIVRYKKHFSHIYLTLVEVEKKQNKKKKVNKKVEDKLKNK